MSLIQEALRRRDDESGSGPGKIPPRVVLPVNDAETPTPSPPTAALPNNAVRSRFWRALTMLLAVGLVVAVGVLGWFFYQFAPFLKSSRESLFASNRVPSVIELTEADLRERKPAIAPVREEESTAELVKLAPETPVAGQSVAPESKQGDVSKVAMPPTAAASVPVTAPRLPDATATVSTGAVVETSVGGGSPRTSSVVAMRSVALAAKTSAWPRLTLNGVMAQTGPARGSAILNGTVVEIEEKIEGVRLVEVRRSGVLLEFKGNTQFVRVGQSTY